MKLTGEQIIASMFKVEDSDSDTDVFWAEDPATNKPLEPSYFETSADEVDKAFKEAEKAFWIYRGKTPEQRAAFLEKIGEKITDLGDTLIERCMQETGLPRTRLLGERGRTVNQLNLFANVLREGSWVEARIDTALPHREPVPKPDLRRMLIPLGPVGVFGASNFPLAFSVAGGDTASALAAGCPVVVKAHPAHPGTSELVGRAIVEAVRETDMPGGVFSLVHGRSVNVGMAMVKHPLAKSIAFTGSYRGGKALYDAAVQRTNPIPVYAEMGSSNPVFILPGALKERRENIAKGLAGSVTLGVGQFCTNPGVVILVGDGKPEIPQEFVKQTKTFFSEAAAGTMLTSMIKDAYDEGLDKLRNTVGVVVEAEGKPGEGGCAGVPHLLSTTAVNFLEYPELANEVFGPCTILVTTDTKEQALEVAFHLSGHLTTTLHATGSDLETYGDLIDVLETKAGRLVINGFPTGVEVCPSMQHGGPFPATTDSRSTSVGTAAITRFARPVCYQGFPQSALPDALKDDNPLSILRLVDGKWTTDKL